MHSPCHCHSQRRAEKDKKKQKKEASLIAVGVGATAAAVQKNRTLVDNDDPAAWLIAAGVILPTKVDDEQSTIEKQSPIQESTVEKQNMELEKVAKKANVLAFMMNKQEQKNVLCPATLHITRPRRYLFITELSSHITFLIYKIAFSVFGSAFYRRKQTPNAAPTREVCVFLTSHHPKTEKISGRKISIFVRGGV